MVQIERNRLPPSVASSDASEAASTTELLANRVVAEGAIMTLPGYPVMRYLVGDFVWLEPNRVFWFTAYGDSFSDGHLLEFDDARVVPDLGIYFSQRGVIAGQLAPIEHAGAEDPDDYRIAWQLWQEVAPLRAAMIEACRERLLGESRLSVDTAFPFNLRSEGKLPRLR